MPDRRGAPPPILLIHSSDEGFGSDRVVLALVDLAVSQGRYVRVLLPADTPDGWLSRQLATRSVEVEKLELAPVRRRYLRVGAVAPYARNLLRAAQNIRAEAKRLPEATIHVSSSTLIAAAALAFQGRRLVWHVQELHISPRFLAWLFRVLPVVIAHHVIAISDFQAAQLRRSRLVRADIRRVYNGIAERPVVASAQRQPTVRCAYVGRLSLRKGYDLFIDAAAAVAPSFPDANFVVAGAPAPGEEWRIADLCQRIERLGLENRMEFLGMCDDVPALLDDMDVVVLPSRWPESFGLVMVEAMRSACTVIASNQGAAPEIIQHDVSGILVRPGELSALQEALAQVLACPTIRDRLSHEARRRVGLSFSEERFRSDVAAVWERARP